MKHTPAPWNITKNGQITHSDTVISDMSTVPNWKANARLIATAPELLEALEDCYSELNQLAFLSGDKLAKITLDKARAAIDKAKGV